MINVLRFWQVFAPTQLVCLLCLSTVSAQEGPGTFRLQVANNDLSPVPFAVASVTRVNAEGLPTGNPEFRLADKSGATTDWTGFLPLDELIVTLFEQPSKFGVYLGVTRSTQMPEPSEHTSNPEHVGLVEIACQPFAQQYSVDGRDKAKARFGPTAAPAGEWLPSYFLLSEGSVYQGNFSLALLPEQIEVEAFWDYMGVVGAQLPLGEDVFGAAVIKTDATDFRQDEVGLLLPGALAGKRCHPFLIGRGMTLEPAAERTLSVVDYSEASTGTAILGLNGTMPSGYIVLVWTESAPATDPIPATPGDTNPPKKGPPGDLPPNFVAPSDDCYDCPLPNPTAADMATTSSCTPSMPNLGSPCPGDGALLSIKPEFYSFWLHERCAGPNERVEREEKIKLTSNYQVTTNWFIGVEYTRTVTIDWTGELPCGTCRADYVYLRVTTATVQNTEHLYTRCGPFTCLTPQTPCSVDSPRSKTCRRWKDTFKACARIYAP